MNLKITIDDMDFDIEIDIITKGFYTPPNLTGHPDRWIDSESEDYEFNILSAVPSFLGVPYIDFTTWHYMDYDTKTYYNDLIMKANQLRRNDYSEKEGQIIVDAIVAELETQ